MRRIIVAASIVLAGLAAAGANPAEDREALMKALGRSVAALAPIARGEKPFDAAEASTLLAALNAEAQKLDATALFPEGDTGEASSPKIWEDWDGFIAAVDKFKTDAAAAADAQPADLAAFQSAFGSVTANCGSCHEVYRVKTN